MENQSLSHEELLSLYHKIEEFLEYLENEKSKLEPDKEESE